MRPHLELRTELSQALNLRFGVAASPASHVTWQGHTPSETRNLSVSALVDWDMADNGVRFTGGALYGEGNWGWQNNPDNTNKYDTTSAELDSSGHWKPYLGFGWDQRFGEEERFAFQVDLGVAFDGVTDLNDNGEGLQKLREEAALGEQFESFRYVPMFSAGVEYRF